MSEYPNVIVNSLDRASYHEAAHLFIGIVLGLKFEHDTIAIKIDWGNEHVTYIESGYKQHDSEEDIIRKIICSLAGQEIEKIVFHDVFDGGIVCDNKNIITLIAYLSRIFNNTNNEMIIQKSRRLCIDILERYYCYIERIVIRLKENSCFMLDEIEEVIPNYQIKRIKVIEDKILKQLFKA